MSNAKEQLTKREELLDSYERSLGLPSTNLFEVDDELQNYFIMDRTQVEKLSSRECSLIAFRLSQYSFQMQRYINREKAIITYAQSKLDQIVANHSDDYDKFTKHEVKIEKICKENSAAEQWKQIIIWARQRVQRLEELARGIDNLSYRISMVQKHKEE